MFDLNTIVNKNEILIIIYLNIICYLFFFLNPGQPTLADPFVSIHKCVIMLIGHEKGH